MKFFSVALVTLTLLLIGSCEKESNNNYYLQADINGKNELFNRDDYAQEFFGDFTAAFSVAGKNDTANHQVYLSIQHNFDTVITPGTYDINSLVKHFIPGLSYIINDTINYGSAVRPENPYPLSITITSVTKESAKGIFSGIVYNFNNPGDSIVISNGKFNVPFRH